MLTDLILLLVLLLVGRHIPPLPALRWTASRYDRILAAVVVSSLLGWAALFSAYGWAGLSDPEPAPRAVRTLEP